MKNSRVSKYSLVIVFIICMFGIIVYNLLNNDKFLETSVTSIISIVIAVVISYVFVQKKTDLRSKKEKIDKLLYKIQDIIGGESFSLSGKRENLILHRSISNKLAGLKKIQMDKDIMKKIEDIEQVFGDFREFYGNHYNDSEYMEKSRIELINYIQRIDDICDEIHVSLS